MEGSGDYRTSQNFLAFAILRPRNFDPQSLLQICYALLLLASLELVII